ncbi:hypothetical protein PTSG_05027 [Salpingoeca rosetta]|uniref:Ferroxidase n=1 Tax=Salpingoeca rosetta (strain ATCC 50818 / BSB-021) TaxID=946362 RepID=F2U9A8_SALR5|nr:uncharacterized protein PTSG_05027 [Salpingoeca rosetta]EGD73311.1 hypothetical protein PTSG_05027 [Salpingoeca rosetta]|eukprot:XP_004994342.1 hypothetical protein PTSG_05027 [Salpingoeca rosetta]
MMSGGRAASRAAVLLSRVARAGARTRLVGRQLRSTRLLAAMPASAAHPSLLQRRTTTPCTSVLRAIRLSSTLTTPEYHKLADAWLDAMHDTFEDLIDGATGSENYDVSLSNGVLTLALDEHGTYVINKQTPNKQIWFSSPTT